MSRLVTRRLVRSLILLSRNGAYRFYSDKFKSIDDFNKNKKEYKFGYGVDEMNLDVEKNDEPEYPGLKDPRLASLKLNSPEYKYQLHLIQEEYKGEQEKERASWERIERIKGMGAGALAIVSIISVYLFVMNYKYLRAYVNNKLNFDIDDSKVKDLNDPQENMKNSERLLERLLAELGPLFKQELANSDETPGLYLFGGAANKLPSRVKGFNGMYLRDVQIQKDYVVAVDESGKVFHYSRKLQEPVQILLPHKISSVVLSGENIYYLSQKQNEIFCGPKLDANFSSKGWFSSGQAYAFDTIKTDSFERGEKIKLLSAGVSHLLILTTKGRLFGASTGLSPVNKGQYALPKYSPYAENPDVPVHEAFELTNLNNEIVTDKLGTKSVRRRTFSSIASGKDHNIASETNGNIWTWGENSYGQCGKEISDLLPLPRLAFTLNDLKGMLKYSLPGKGAAGDFSVAQVYSTDETSFIRMYYTDQAVPQNDQELLLSFGAGIKGQLGTSRFVHVSAKPTVIKSLVGLTEYNELLKGVLNIGIKSISAGGNHVFVTLNNEGHKDVLVFGDNESGQFGNGKTVKSAKPLQLPKLIEPSDFDGDETKAKKKLARKLNDVSTRRLQLVDGTINGKNVEQVVVAGTDGSAIFYHRK